MSFNNTKTPTKSDKPAKWQLPMRVCQRNGRMEYYLEGELKEKFIKLYPKNYNRKIMEWFGISFSTTHRFARELGLKKDMKVVKKKHARDVKRICEKNGWYASLKGKAPTEACLEAYKKKRATGWNPIQQMKKTSTRRYNAFCKKVAETRKELWRKEYLRDQYGLERKSKLRLKTLSHKAVNQKYMMKRECNYFADKDNVTWICYDSQTKRSAKREATAIKYGLKVVQGDE